MRNTFSSVFAWAAFLLTGTAGVAQGSRAAADSLLPYRLFLERCTAYKQLPLQLDVEMRKQTNFLTDESDTGSTVGRFLLRPGLAYVRFGEAEQIVTDSAALLVSDKLKQMFFFADPGTVAATLKSFAGLGSPQASLAELANRYTASVDSLSPAPKILLTARRRLPVTDLPTESMELFYHPQTAQPDRMVTVKRTMIPISKEDYLNLTAQRKDLPLIQAGEARCFLIKEQTGTFIYRSIRHEKDAPPPATLADRIKKMNDGQYAGVKDYAAYSITVN